MSLAEMEGRDRLDFWNKDNTRLILKFESMVPALVECSAFWVSGGMKLVRCSDCTVEGEWMSSVPGSIWSEKGLRMEAEVSLMSERSTGNLDPEAGRQGAGERCAKEQSSRDLSKTEWPVLSKAVGSK